jgi:phosphatidylinositol-3-phosphatase
VRWLLFALLCACGDNLRPQTSDGDASFSDATNPNDEGTVIAGPRTLFVIVMENQDASTIYGNTTDVPYINSLFSLGGRADAFVDLIPNLPSEPHYIWMEAGTNTFTDHTFTTNNVSSASNSTSSTEHLVTQLQAAGIPWVTYQDGMKVGTCPLAGFGAQVAKHDPFVFFQDVAGDPPALTTPYCIEHHRPFTDFEADLAAGLEGYVFITPSQCHDMHGQPSCPSGTDPVANLRAGDAWLASELPRIIDYTRTHDAVIFLAWDEAKSSQLPFVILGNHVRAGYTSTTEFTHSTMLATAEDFLGVPRLPTVADTPTFAEMFESGTFP